MRSSVTLTRDPDRSTVPRQKRLVPRITNLWWRFWQASYAAVGVPLKGALMTIRVWRRLGMGFTVAALFVGCISFAPGLAASASQKALSCKIVSPAEIKATLGLSVSKPVANELGSGLGLDCAYTVANTAGTMKVTVHFQSPVTRKQFKSSISTFGVTKEVPGLGNLAYSNVMGSGKYALITLYVLQGTTEFWVGAVAPLAKAEKLAREILPKI